MQQERCNVKVCYINIQSLSRSRLFKSRNMLLEKLFSAQSRGDQRLGAPFEDRRGVVSTRRIEMAGEGQHRGAMR